MKKFARRLSAFLIFSTILIGGLVLAPASEIQQSLAINQSPVTEQLSIGINGRILGTEIQPIITSGRVMVPLRTVAEALQAQVEWDAASGTAVVTRENNILQLKAGSRAAYKNQQSVTLEIPAYLDQGRMMVPIRFIAEALGAAVEWNGRKHMVNILTPLVIPQGSSTPALIAYSFNGTLMLLDGKLSGQKAVAVQTPYKSMVNLIKWSADGKWVMFTVRKLDAENDWLYYLWVVKADGTGAYQVESEPIFAAPSWSPASNTIAYSTNKADSQYPDRNLKLAAIGNAKAVVTALLPENSDVADYAWAPDGKSLAVSLARTTKQPLKIDSISLQGVRTNLLTNGEPVSAEEGIYNWAAVGLKWSPNGRYLAYHLNPNSASMAADGVGMQVLDVNRPNRPIELGGGLSYAEWFAWAPDSSKLAYIAGSGREATINKRVGVIDLQAGGMITDYGRQNFVDIDPAWTTNSPYSLLVSRGTENIDWEGQAKAEDVLVPDQRIWMLSSGGTDKLLTSGPTDTADYAPVVSPDGKYLFYMRLTGLDNGVLYQQAFGDDKATPLVNLVGLGDSNYYGSYLPFPYDVYL